MHSLTPAPSTTASAARDLPLDLDAELSAAVSAMRPLHVERLTALGVPQFLTCPVLPLIGVARVLFEGDFYQPHGSGEPAVIVAVRADGGDGLELEHAAPRAVALIGDGVVDLIAFTPTHWDRFALRAGNAVMLGLMPPQLLRPEPVPFRRTPLDWLRADAEGVCILDRRPHVVAGILASAHGGIVVADAEHGRALRAIAERPWSVPPIFVAEPERRAAA
jgi:hypothetical protein